MVGKKKCKQDVEVEAEVYLGEEPPPLPVPELKISSTVPLDDLHCSQLLLSLGKGPAKQNQSAGRL